MINLLYIKHSDYIKKEYNETFTEQSNEKKFEFLQKYLKFIENDNSPCNYIEIYEDPTLDNQNINEIKEFNKTINEFLTKISKLSIISNNDKKLVRKAYFYIGVGYEYGLFDFSIDFNLAFINYKIAAKLSSSYGTYKIAQCYEKGQGVRKSYTQALCFYRCAAKLGLIDAVYTFGMILLQGNLTSDIDEKTGFSYLQHAVNIADPYYPFPCFDMGLIFEKGITKDLPVDKKYAFEMYKKGAEMGDPNSMYKIAQAYEYGDLMVTENTDKASEYYHRAGEKGHLDAILYLANSYDKGILSKADESNKKRLKWNMKAALKFNSIGLYKCGEHYEYGLGVEKDLLMALWYYIMAKDAGHTTAIAKIRNINNIINKLDLGEKPQFSCLRCIFSCK